MAPDMTGKKSLFLYLLVVLAAGSSTGLARLGETSKAIEGRYGPPLSTRILSDFTRCQYQKQSFAITIIYQNGHSVIEIFAKRGLSQDDAGKVAELVATHPVGAPDSEHEDQIRQATGITSADERFWVWTSPTSTIAAFNPVDCTVAFFSEPEVYVRVQQALASASLAGS